MSKTSSTTAIKAYLTGIKNSFSAWKIWALLYFFNIVFTLIVIAPISKLLDEKIGQSLLPEKWQEGFNYTVMHDFLANYDVSVTTFTRLTLVVGLLYLVFSIFTAGGIVAVFLEKNKGNQLRTFWSACSYFFWRILRLTFYFLCIHGLIAGLFGFIFFKAAKGFSPDNIESELVILNAFYWILPMYLFAAIVVSLWQDFTKIQLVKDDQRLFTSSFSAASQFVFTNFGKVLFFYILNLLTLGIFYLIYRSGSLAFTSMNAIFFFGQILVIGRIGIKLWITAGGVELLAAKQ